MITNATSSSVIAEADDEALLLHRLPERRGLRRGDRGRLVPPVRGVTALAHDEIAVLARGVNRMERRSAMRFTTT